jgi:YD repeat-containing protein
VFSKEGGQAPLAVTLANGVTTSYTYDGSDRLTDLVTRSGGETVAAFRYTLDLTGCGASRPDRPIAYNRKHSS